MVLGVPILKHFRVLVNSLGGLSLPRKSVVRLTDRPDMTLDVYRGRKTTMQQQHFYSTFDGRFCTVDLVQMPHDVASDLSLHCLSMTLLQVSRLEWV